MVDKWNGSFDSNWRNFRTYGSDIPKSVGQQLADFFNYANKQDNPYLGQIANKRCGPPDLSEGNGQPKGCPV